MVRIKRFFSVTTAIIFVFVIWNWNVAEHHYIQVLNNDVWKIGSLEKPRVGFLFRYSKEQLTPSTFYLESDSFRIDVIPDHRTSYPALDFRVGRDSGLVIELEGLTECIISNRSSINLDIPPRYFERLSLYDTGRCRSISSSFFEEPHQVSVLVLDESGQELLRAPLEFIVIDNGWYLMGPAMP